MQEAMDLWKDRLRYDGTTVTALRVIWNERCGSQFQTVCWYLSGMTEEKHKILNNDRSSSSSNLNPEFPANEAQLLRTTGKLYVSYFTSELVSALTL